MQNAARDEIHRGSLVTALENMVKEGSEHRAGKSDPQGKKLMIPRFK